MSKTSSSSLSSRDRIVAIVINYQTAKLTKTAVESLIPQLTDQDKIIVVDNSEDQRQFDILKQQLDKLDHKRIDLLQARRNLGFSGGVNFVLKRYQASYYLLLNSDARLERDCLSLLLQEIDSAPKQVGLVYPNLKYENGQLQESEFNFYSPLSEFSDHCQSKLVSRTLSRYTLTPPRDLVSPDWVSFACVLFKSDMFEKVGLMDAGYFLYFEDIDYCKRVKQAGFELKKTEAASAVHLRGQSSTVKSNIIEGSRLPKYYFASRSRYLSKFYGGKLGLAISNILVTLAILIGQSKRLLGRKPRKINLFFPLDVWHGFTDTHSDTKIS